MSPLPYRRKLLISVATVFAFTLAVRLALLACVAPALRVSEFADDALYYRALIQDPTMLVTGRIVPDMEGGVIYSPLMPFGISFPGRWLAHIFGFSIGHRLGMIFYDTVAVSIAMGIAWWKTSPPKGFREWFVAMALTAVPGSALASAVWGQEDTLAAVWAALCLFAVVTRRPVLAAAVAGFGVFTIKMFAVLLVMGIWLGTPGRRRAITVAGSIPVLLFIGFACLRWWLSGLATPTPTYKGLSNSASIYAAFHYLVRPVTFFQVQPAVIAVTGLMLAGLTWLCWKTKVTPVAAVVVVHAAFFLTFIGIQPEHHQWFMPFLLVLAWSAFRAREYALLACAWAFSFWAYAYKITFGLQGSESASSAGKDVFRGWFAQHVQASLFPLQMLALGMTLATAAALCVLCFRYGVRERRREEGLAVADAEIPPVVQFSHR